MKQHGSWVFGWTTFYKLVPEQIAATKDAQGKWRIAPDAIEEYRTRRFGRKAAE